MTPVYTHDLKHQGDKEAIEKQLVASSTQGRRGRSVSRLIWPLKAIPPELVVTDAFRSSISRMVPDPGLPPLSTVENVKVLPLTLPSRIRTVTFFAVDVPDTRPLSTLRSNDMSLLKIPQRTEPDHLP
jgi:hypothetical protein